MTQTESQALSDQTHSDAHPATGRRPRWLIPAVAIVGVIAAVLLVSGLVSPWLLIYGGALAGCGLMHLFGHGGHGGHGGGTPPAKP